MRLAEDYYEKIERKNARLPIIYKDIVQAILREVFISNNFSNETVKLINTKVKFKHYNHPIALERIRDYTIVRRVCRLWKTVADETFQFPHQRSLTIAIKKKNVAAIAFLIRKMPKGDFWYIQDAINIGSTPILQMFMDHYPYRDPSFLWNACKSGNIDMLKIVLNDPGMKQFCIEHGDYDLKHPAIVKELLDHNITTLATLSSFSVDKLTHEDSVSLILDRFSEDKCVDEMFIGWASKKDSRVKLLRRLLEKEVDLKRREENLVAACRKGQIKVVELFLEFGLDPRGFGYNTLIEAVSHGMHHIVQLLFATGKMEPSNALSFQLVKTALSKDLHHIAMELLNRLSLDYSDEENILIQLALTNSDQVVAKRLLSNPNVNPFFEDDRCLLGACRMSDLDLVQRIIEGSYMKDFVEIKALTNAVEEGNKEVVRLLLRDERVKPTVALLSIAKDEETTRLLWEHPSINQSHKQMKLFDMANPALLRLMARDGKVDEETAIRLLFYALDKGNNVVVGVLINFLEVDVSVLTDEVINTLIEKGNMEVFQILLASPKMDIQRLVNLAFTSKSADIIRLILKHPNFNPSELSRSQMKTIQYYKIK